MKIKVAELGRPLLDFYAGMANNVTGLACTETECYARKDDISRIETYSPSTDWLQGGLIIEREKISILPRIDGSWYAEIPMELKQDGNFSVGATPLIAAMRCFVADKFGEEVEE